MHKIFHNSDIFSSTSQSPLPHGHEYCKKWAFHLKPRKCAASHANEIEVLCEIEMGKVQTVEGEDKRRKTAS